MSSNGYQQTVNTTENIRGVLIVEKESFFFNLLSLNFFNYFPDLLLVTGKGYPDFQTREFLIGLKEIYGENLEYFYLGDLDPHGIEIYLNYCFSTKISVFEDHGLPWINFCGLYPDRRLGQIQKGVQYSSDDIDKINEIIDLPFFGGEVDREEYLMFRGQNEAKNEGFLRIYRKLKETIFWMREAGIKYELESMLELGSLEKENLGSMGLQGSQNSIGKMVFQYIRELILDA